MRIRSAVVLVLVSLCFSVVPKVSHAERVTPVLGWVWFAPLFAGSPPNATDASNRLPGPEFGDYPSPQEAGTGYCSSINTGARVVCGPIDAFLPCGYECNTGGGTALARGAVCYFNSSAPTIRNIDGEDNVVCIFSDLDNGKNTGCPNCSSDKTPKAGDPINLGTGNSYQVERDYAGGGAFPLRFERHYNSDGAANANSLIIPANGTPAQPYMTKRWKHTYHRALVVDPRAPSIVRAMREDGRNVYFIRSGGLFFAESDEIDKLDRLTDGSGNLTGWRFTAGRDDSIELYGPQGQLLSITDRTGLQQTLSYDAAGRLTTVTDPFGATLAFGYDTAGRLTSVTDPAGGVYAYAYDSTGRLVSVTYPDTTTRQYLYENASFPEALTAIIDEKGVRFASWTYDAQARAISSENAGGANRVSAPDAAHVTDAFNNTRAYAIQSVQGGAANTGITGPACPSCGPAAQTFDANGNTGSRTDWNGNRTNFTYDLTRNVEISRTEALTSGGGTTPQTRTISTQWDPVFRLPTQIAEPLRITTNVYDPDGTQCGARGKLCSKTIQATSDATGALGFGATPTGTPRTWTYTYDMNGRVLTANGPRTDVADVTAYTYYANNDLDLGKRGNVATVTNALGHTTNIASYNAHGQPLTIVDANGMTTTMTYDARRRLTSRTAGGETTNYDYDAAGQLTKVTLPDGSFLSYAYDDAHRMSGMQDNLGNRIAYALDAMGNRTLEQVFDPSNSLAQTRTRVYSNLNRLFQEIGATGQTTQYAYDDQGNATTVTVVIPSGNQVTTSAYDALNRVKQVTDPANGTTQYAYNGQNALTQVTDPRSLATSYNLDGLSNLNQQVSPDTGTTSNTYDSAGNLLFQTDAKGQVTSYVYDPLNRATLITFNDGSKQSYAYDLGPNALGHLSSIIETDASNQTTSIIAYAYEQHGRVTQETRTIAGVQYALGYTYDAAGRLSGLTYPSGRTIAYGFDAAGRVNSINTTASGQTQAVVSNVTYHPFGGVNGFTLGNGRVYSRPRDYDGRVSSYTLGAQSFAIAYDAANRITAIADAGNAANFNNYGYDALDRLTLAQSPSTTYNYAYDAVGNRTLKNSGGASESYAYSPASNRIASLTPASGPTRTFSFDANGSTINDGLNAYIYDPRGRMVQATSLVGTTNYQINALGQRIRKTNSSDDRVFHYDTKGKLIAESDPGGTIWKREYIYLGDIPVGVVQ
jgi:YD repeat-containing protein